MRSFSEYYEDLENNEPLNEEVFSYIITGVVGLPILVAVSWGAAWVTKKYVSFTKRMFLGLARNIKAIGSLFKRNRKEAVEKIENTVVEIEKAPEVVKAVREVEKLENKYFNELEELYGAIKEKNIDEAEELYNDLPINTQENPEVKVAIINVILKEFKEPPVYTTSPGNETYQAIKRLFGQKVARAMEELGKRGFSKYYERVSERDE